MPQTAASRARAERLRERIATIRKAHAQAGALAAMTGSEPPPYSHLGLLGVADYFPPVVADQTGDRHLIGSLEDALTLVERELAQGWPPHDDTRPAPSQ